MAGWEAAAISGGVNLLGYGLQRAAEDRSYYRNLQLMKMQNDFNVDMWNRTNAYNSPSNQVKLLRDAGINPAMATPGTSQASEVTSASAEVPYNQDAASPLRDAASAALSALQTEAQVAKLRNEIKYQKMVNEDYELRLAAAKEKHELPFDNLPAPEREDDEGIEYRDGEGHISNVTVTAPKKYNQYEMERKRYEEGYRGERTRNLLTDEEYQVYRASSRWLKKMPEKQYLKLCEELIAAQHNNTILGRDAEIAKKFGINPQDDGYKALIKIALSDPDSFIRILRALGENLFHTGEFLGGLFSGFGSTQNPHSAGSW